MYPPELSQLSERVYSIMLWVRKLVLWRINSLAHDCTDRKLVTDESSIQTRSCLILQGCTASMTT